MQFRSNQNMTIILIVALVFIIVMPCVWKFISCSTTRVTHSASNLTGSARNMLSSAQDMLGMEQFAAVEAANVFTGVPFES